MRSDDVTIFREFQDFSHLRDYAICSGKLISAVFHRKNKKKTKKEQKIPPKYKKKIQTFFIHFQTFFCSDEEQSSRP